MVWPGKIANFYARTRSKLCCVACSPLTHPQQHHFTQLSTSSCDSSQEITKQAQVHVSDTTSALMLMLDFYVSVFKLKAITVTHWHTHNLILCVCECEHQQRFIFLLLRRLDCYFIWRQLCCPDSALLIDIESHTNGACVCVSDSEPSPVTQVEKHQNPQAHLDWTVHQKGTMHQGW